MQLVILVYKLTYWPQFDDYRLRIFFFGGHMGEWWRPQCDEQLDTAQTGSVLTEEEWRAVSHDIVERMGAVWWVSKPRRGEEGRGGVGSRSKALWVGFLRGEKVWGFWRRPPDGHVSHASVSATMQRPTKCVRAGLNTAAACWCEHNEESCIGTSHNEGEAAVEQWIQTLCLPAASPCRQPAPRLAKMAEGSRGGGGR